MSNLVPLPANAQTLATALVSAYDEDFPAPVVERYLQGIYNALLATVDRDVEGHVTVSVINELFVVNVVALLGDRESTFKKLQHYKDSLEQ